MKIASAKIILAGLVLSLACAEEAPGSRRDPSEPVQPDGGGGGAGGSSEGCPEGQPKVGENCGPGITESTSCTFNVGECVGPNGMTYNETVSYCCALGVWEACDSRSPCANFDYDASVAPGPDAGAPDAPAGDGGDDALTDGGPDADPSVDAVTD
jgi:hypothetical protein